MVPSPNCVAVTYCEGDRYEITLLKTSLGNATGYAYADYGKEVTVSPPEPDGMDHGAGEIPLAVLASPLAQLRSERGSLRHEVLGEPIDEAGHGQAIPSEHEMRIHKKGGFTKGSPLL